jgi:hypothetical protein
LRKPVDGLFRADAERGGAVAVGLRQSGQRGIKPGEMIAELGGVRGALVRRQTLRRVRQHHFVAALDRVARRASSSRAASGDIVLRLRQPSDPDRGT